MSDRHITINVVVTDDDRGNAVLCEEMISVTVPPLTAPAPDDLRIEIAHGGTVYAISIADAMDMGDFVSHRGGFTQQCSIYLLDELGMRVFFRPDADDQRHEIVFERGQCHTPGDPLDIGSYEVTIYLGEGELAHVAVPHHWLFTRWRWQSSARPIVCTSEDLVNAHLVPPYRFDSSRPAVARLVPYTPMTLAGIEPYMPSTGERPDIGLMTDPQAEFLITEGQTALDVVMAQAEAAGTCDWHMRDETTGAPISFATYPKACWFQDQQQGEPFVSVPKGAPVTLDNAHQPALAYLPYLLTGDPYHLETLQFQATWNYGQCSLGYRPTLSQTRAWAWDMRTLGQCVQVTPETVPCWLLPREYWQALAQNHRDYFDTKYLKSAAPEHTIFRCTDNLGSRGADGDFPAGTWQQVWQEDFLGAVLGWLIAMGQTEWREEFDWLIGSVTARTQKDGGWPRAQCTPYQMLLRSSSTAPVASSWAACWDLNHTQVGMDYEDPNTWALDDMTYLSYTRAALACARVVEPKTDEAFRWASDQMKQVGWLPAFKWSIG